MLCHINKTTNKQCVCSNNKHCSCVHLFYVWFHTQKCSVPLWSHLFRWIFLKPIALLLELHKHCHKMSREKRRSALRQSFTTLSSKRQRIQPEIFTLFFIKSHYAPEICFSTDLYIWPLHVHASVRPLAQSLEKRKSMYVIYWIIWWFYSHSHLVQRQSSIGMFTGGIKLPKGK